MQKNIQNCTGYGLGTAGETSAQVNIAYYVASTLKTIGLIGLAKLADSEKGQSQQYFFFLHICRLDRYVLHQYWYQLNPNKVTLRAKIEQTSLLWFHR